jgi:hypothetical protein
MSLDAAVVRLGDALVGDVRVNEIMARHTTFRIGGPAAILCELAAIHDVAEALRILREEEVPWTVLGKGSNVLVADSGYEGVSSNGMSSRGARSAPAPRPSWRTSCKMLSTRASSACRGVWAYPARSGAHWP